MGKIKDYLNKPYTRGDVLKYSLWSMGLSAVMWGGMYVYSLYEDRKYYKERYHESLGIGFDPTEEETEMESES